MLSLKTTYDSSERTWSGQEKEGKAYPNMSVGEALFRSMRTNPTNICQISDTDGVSFTNEEMLTRSIRIAQHLNLEEGDIIGIMAVSSTYQAPVVFAAFLKGIIFHPINAFFDQNTVRHLFGITRPKVIFCDADNYEIVVGACKELDLELRVYTITGRVDGIENVHDLMEPTGKEDSFCPQKCRKSGDDTAMIICSSGTTGLPKGVCVSNTYFLDSNLSLLPPDFVVFTFSNIDWMSGMMFLVSSVLSNSTKVCTTEKFSPEKLRQIIEKYKVSFTMVAGSQLSYFVKSGEAQRCDTSSLRLFAIGGANVSHPLYVEMQSYIQTGYVSNAYVGTEFGGVAINISIGKPKAVGQLLNGVKVRIVDDNNARLGIGETGEILVWNNQHWAGYYGNPTETLKILDTQGWFHTGDLGFIDEDGDLHIIDRKKEIMKFRAFHYSAQEIENCILGLSDVREVCVFGTQSDEDGDLPTAAVIRKPGTNLTEAEIVDHVAREMYEPKWLRGGVYFVEDIPKTGSGKYLRRKTRDMCLGIKSN